MMKVVCRTVAAGGAQYNLVYCGRQAGRQARGTTNAAAAQGEVGTAPPSHSSTTSSLPPTFDHISMTSSMTTVISRCSPLTNVTPKVHTLAAGSSHD